MKHLLIILISIFLLSSPVIGQSENLESHYLIKTKNKKIYISKDRWSQIGSSDTYSRNFEALQKRNDQQFKQMITVFLTRMTKDRKREEIAQNEYIEGYVLRPFSITIIIRFDKGDYWVMSRESFNIEVNYPIYKSFTYSDLVYNFRDIQDKIDRTRYILYREF